MKVDSVLQIGQRKKDLYTDGRTSFNLSFPKFGLGAVLTSQNRELSSNKNTQFSSGKTTMKEYGLLTYIHLSDTPFLNHNSCDNNCDNIISHPPLLMLLL